MTDLHSASEQMCLRCSLEGEELIEDPPLGKVQVFMLAEAV